MERLIKIETKEKVQRICELATYSPYEVWLNVNGESLDARSILGLFSLVGKEAYVVVEDDVDRDSFNKLMDKIEAK